MQLSRMMHLAVAAAALLEGCSSGQGATSSDADGGTGPGAAARDAGRSGNDTQEASTSPGEDASSSGEDASSSSEEAGPAPTPPTSATLVFGYPNGFTGSDAADYSTYKSQAIYLGDADLSGSSIRLINSNGHNSAGAWYTTKLPPTPFTTQFSFTPSGLGSGSVVQSGMTFTIQDTVAQQGQPAYSGDGIKYGGDANMCGYGGATNQLPPEDSIAIKFDAGDESAGANYPPGSLPSSTGLYFNGGPSVYPGGSLGLVPENDLHPYGINFYSGDTYDVTIVYDGSLLTMVIRDTKTNAQAREVWPLNLAKTTNATGSYVGFTAGTAKQGDFEIENWSYWSGYNTRLATPTLSPVPGEYSGAQSVTMSCPSGATCYYTTNGLAPTSASTKYTGPIAVGANVVIQAVAIESDYTDSLVATGSYQIGTPNLIDFPNGFAAGNVIPAGFAYLTGSRIRLGDASNPNGGSTGAAWFPIPVSVSSFNTEFTWQWGPNSMGTAFVIQNNPPPYFASTNNPNANCIGDGSAVVNGYNCGYKVNWSGGPTAVGAGFRGFGYGGLNAYNGTNGNSYGLLNSVAIAFDVGGVMGDPPNSVGLYTNGANPYGSSKSTGLTWTNGHTYDVSIGYDGTTMTLAMSDTTVPGTTFKQSFNIDIPTTVGGDTAYVGFTGGTYGNDATQDVLSWTYSK